MNLMRFYRFNCQFRIKIHKLKSKIKPYIYRFLMFALTSNIFCILLYSFCFDFGIFLLIFI